MSYVLRHINSLSIDLNFTFTSLLSAVFLLFAFCLLWPMVLPNRGFKLRVRLNIFRWTMCSLGDYYSRRHRHSQCCSVRKLAPYFPGLHGGDLYSPVLACEPQSRFQSRSLGEPSGLCESARWKNAYLTISSPISRGFRGYMLT